MTEMEEKVEIGDGDGDITTNEKGKGNEVEKHVKWSSSRRCRRLEESQRWTWAKWKDDLR